MSSRIDRNEILNLTYHYSSAFGERRTETLEVLLAEDAQLKDPDVELSGREEIMNFFHELYSKNNVLDFFADRIIVIPEEAMSIIEFTARIGNVDVTRPLVHLIRGTDHITWNSNGEITRIEAFLYFTGKERGK